MRLDEECKGCLYKSQLKKVEKDCKDGEKLNRFKSLVKSLCQNPPEQYCAPLLMRDIDKIYRQIMGTGIDYSKEKELFNACLLQLEDKLFNQIISSEQPLKQAIRYAMASNYLDFARLSDLDESSISLVFESAERATVDENTYTLFKDKLKGAKTLLYLHDNCGEVVLDKLLIRTIKREYSQIEIISVVRGGEIINDATQVDAKQIGLENYAQVISNGTAIPGTYLKEINEETKRLLQSADVIISKGLGNLETLFGEGYNIFYLFMCKCNHIASAFKLPLWSTAFIYQGE